MTQHTQRVIHTISLLVMLCVHTTVVAQAKPLLSDSLNRGQSIGDTRPLIPQRDRQLSLEGPRRSMISREAQTIALSDSLHRAAATELGLPTEETEFSDSEWGTDSTTMKGPLTRRKLRKQQITTFTPDPSKATWSGIVFPGGGQIYNHKYWKLPIVYGGFLGCAYALNWNNQMYSDYSQAYLDIMDDDPGTASYEDFLPPRYDVEANKEYLTRVFKNRKDNYRRQRDLSIFCFIGVYLISVIDAYVDAELSNFDISEDLSVQVRPTTIDNRQQNLRTQSYGLQCSFSF